MDLMVHTKIGFLVLLLACISVGSACSQRDLIPMQVELSRSVSKLPFVIALDQGLYEKYGLEMDVKMEPPAFEGGIHLPSKNLVKRLWRRLLAIAGKIDPWKPDIRVSGANSRIVAMTTSATEPDQVSLAATDCVARTHIVAKKNIETLADLKGKRLGVSSLQGNTGYIALLLAQRMGWDPVFDLSILASGNNIAALQDGHVDAFVANERSHFPAMQAGLKVLTETSEWNAPMAGNSVNVRLDWLQDPDNRDVARRFIQATIEGIALFHQDRELVMGILERWHGITDPAYAAAIYESGRWIPRKPYPCHAGIRKAIEIYDSNEMRKHSPADFYDDRLVRELDESGFIDSLYSHGESLQR